MKADGLTPIAFTDKDGWPAMGTFDIINMRMNGYDFHVRLMAGKASWDSPQVKRVFNTWRELLPYTSDGALGLTWQEGAQQLANKEAGMYMLGTFVGQQFTGAVQKDIDFFAYPAINPKWGQDSIDAPIDGFCMAKKGSNSKEAKALLSYLGTATAENIYLASDPNDVGANKNANKSRYTALQKKSALLISKTAHIAQYLDRDTRPDFASTVMIPALQQFLNQPGGRERPGQEHPEAEGGDLRVLRRSLRSTRWRSRQPRGWQRTARNAGGAPSASRPVTSSRSRSWSGSRSSSSAG